MNPKITIEFEGMEDGLKCWISRDKTRAVHLFVASAALIAAAGQLYPAPDEIQDRLDKMVDDLRDLATAVNELEKIKDAIKEGST